MPPLPFRKYHGLGNDFLLFDGLTATLPLDRLTDPQLARQLCDRHLGIGGDGLLLVLPPSTPAAPARMRVINADGSEPEMCGNGIRCVAKALHDHLGVTGVERLGIDTGAGLLWCDLTLGADERVSSVRVDMGRPSLERASLPMQGEGRFVEETLRVGAVELRSTAVSMGNPHLVSFVQQEPRDLAERLGPVIEKHPLFPRRTNVEFARLQGGGLELWVWERGCGITLACGTGACATAVAAVATGRHPAGRPLKVQLPGGALTILVAEDLGRVWMDGPAVEVFEGTVSV